MAGMGVQSTVFNKGLGLAHLPSDLGILWGKGRGLAPCSRQSHMADWQVGRIWASADKLANVIANVIVKVNCKITHTVECCKVES